MSHIHIPDGILAWWIWLPALILVVGLLTLIFKGWNQEEARRLIPLAAMMSALMLITMSLPLFIVPVHLTLAVLAGLMVGPKMAFLSILVVNTLLASLGHGGFTLIGLNTLIIGAEMVVGVYIFRFISKRLPTIPSAIVATMMGILLSLSMSVGLIATTVGLAEALPHEDHDHEEHDHSDEEGFILEIPERFVITLPEFYHVQTVSVIDDHDEHYKVLLISDDVEESMHELMEALIEAGWDMSDNSDLHHGWYLKDNVELHVKIDESKTDTIELELTLLSDEQLSDHDHDHDHDEEHNHDHDDVDTILSELNYLGFSGWLAVIMIYLVGILFESSATGFIYQSLKRIKKD